MEEKPEELELYYEEDGQKKVRVIKVKTISGLDDEQLGEKILGTISNIKPETGKPEYRHLIIFWNGVSRSWDCQLRTEIVRLEKIWSEEKRKHLNPIIIENSGKYWIIKGTKQVPYETIKAFMDLACSKRGKQADG